jgi:hypothetical protein
MSTPNANRPLPTWSGLCVLIASRTTRCRVTTAFRSIGRGRPSAEVCGGVWAAAGRVATPVTAAAAEPDTNSLRVIMSPS